MTSVEAFKHFTSTFKPQKSYINSKYFHSRDRRFNLLKGFIFTTTPKHEREIIKVQRALLETWF